MTGLAPAFRLRQTDVGVDGHPVLADVDVCIRAGERVALLGASGSGKTTLLRALRALNATQSAWCPQHSGLVPLLSVFHNIYMGRLDRYSAAYNLLNLVRPTAPRRREITDLAARLGLAEHLWHSVDRLSGGQQGRVNLGRALYQERPIFIGDEPITAVDEHHAHDLLTLICGRHQTVVVALHNVDLALRHCQRIIGLKAGRVVLDEPSDTLCAADLARLYPAAS